MSPDQPNAVKFETLFLMLYPSYALILEADRKEEFSRSRSIDPGLTLKLSGRPNNVAKRWLKNAGYDIKAEATVKSAPGHTRAGPNYS